MDIEHVTESGDSHGPVAVFLSNGGTIAFVCRRDRAYWESAMPQVTPPIGTSEEFHLADRLSGADRGSPPSCDVGVDLEGHSRTEMTLAEARELAISRLGATEDA